MQRREVVLAEQSGEVGARGAGGDKKQEVVMRGREPGAVTGASFPQPSSRLHTHTHTPSCTFKCRQNDMW